VVSAGLTTSAHRPVSSARSLIQDVNNMLSNWPAGRRRLSTPRQRLAVPRERCTGPAVARRTDGGEATVSAWLSDRPRPVRPSYGTSALTTGLTATRYLYVNGSLVPTGVFCQQITAEARTCTVDMTATTCPSDRRTDGRGRVATASGRRSVVIGGVLC